MAGVLSAFMLLSQLTAVAEEKTNEKDFCISDSIDLLSVDVEFCAC